MSTISSFTFINSNSNILFPFPLSPAPPPSSRTSSELQLLHPSSHYPKLPSTSVIRSISSRKSLIHLCCKSPEAEELYSPEDEWLQKLPEKKKPLYSHSLPCIEAWLQNLGFCQSNDDRALWFIQKPDWHAQLSLDITDLYIRMKIRLLCRYLKSGPGNLEKDVERRFSYALSREDIENAVLGGP
ncbi:uncharacterized protein LOC114739408 isoform X2 [Neltuma alba]|uniref:uncharacterized protein LOC114739408 isoform X2 n=1 Tax=Neltuma alba TaxID=207710 RepID=UPI0010A35795|nr:uncharacterized protein LOC114739408 isoform X2 [Prosopis alba]